MRKTQAFWLAIVFTLTVLGAHSGASGQEKENSPKPAANSNDTESKTNPWGDAVEAYRIDFSVNELEDGKKINSRQYSMNLSTNQGNEIKIGTRVPVESKEGEFQYLDVGTNIFARIGETRGKTELTVRADLSNFALPEQGQDKHDLHPVIRQIKMGGSTLLPIGRTMVLGSADDPSSKRQFQLEVTVTKLK